MTQAFKDLNELIDMSETMNMDYFSKRLNKVKQLFINEITVQVEADDEG